ncbi:MAG: endopeptidase La [Bacillota bacterium]|jgi:ATP-dependent Lon protease
MENCQNIQNKQDKSTQYLPALDVVDKNITSLPVLPLRGMLLFPSTVVNFDVGRDRSIESIESAMSDDEALIFLAMQKDAKIDNPEPEDIYDIGTVAKIKQLIKLPGGTIRIVTEGLYRAKVVQYTQSEPYIEAEVSRLKEELSVSELEAEALMRIVTESFKEYAKANKAIVTELLFNISNMREPGVFCDTVCSYLTLNSEDKQELLAETYIDKRMEMLINFIDREIEIIELEKKISQKVHQQVEKSQKEYYLREQLKAIHDELGDKEDRLEEAEELRQKAQSLELPPEILKRVKKEIDRLERIPPMVAEAVVVRNYIDWLLDLPWNKYTEDNLDIKAAEKILNEDHYGLEKVKDRILEYIAACQLKKGLKGPILCFVGPPGVGKTSLARSIARALGRNFVRMSLGGVRDEAEIRGHRRTYIGALPGKIIQNLKQSGSANPLFLLDEIDKLSSDFKGDPASALLEALDPEQNNTFSDHYIEAPFDLSKVMFITTANVQYSIPRPLLDRMEIINLSSYTEEEKLQIAIRHLVPKQLQEHGIEANQLQISDNALRIITRRYTREAGVRSLERLIAKICRRVGRKIVSGEKAPFKISEKNIEKYLGIAKYHYGKKRLNPQIGVATGLAWTEMGGDLLQIEVQSLPGKGKMTVTGQLGDVMKESMQAGLTYILSIADKLGIKNDLDETTNLHIHVPEGAIPKDGPSAGITMAAAMASELTKRAIREDIAMTGEITLRGRVLPVGGIKEKVLAAYRGDIKEVIMPSENKKDLEELAPSIKRKLVFHFVNNMSEVLELALLPQEKEAVQ